MRPPEFTGGNPAGNRAAWCRPHTASMRPPEFTGGNGTACRAIRCPECHGFNEAAGIHRRKRGSCPVPSMWTANALQ